MKYKVYLTATFQKSVKILGKKYRRVKKDLVEIIREIEKDPTIGDPIPGWKSEIWKVRARSSDIRRGKRGGFRLIYLWKQEEPIYILAAYFKGEKQDISKKEIEETLKKLNQEIGA